MRTKNNDEKKPTRFSIACPYCKEVLPVHKDRRGNYYVVCGNCLVPRSRREFWHVDFLAALVKLGRVAEVK